MGMFGWLGKQKGGEQASSSPAPDAPPRKTRPKIDKAVAEERARKNSPWRFDDGPSRRPAGGKD
jgi:hypothetical protein